MGDNSQEPRQVTADDLIGCLDLTDVRPYVIHHNLQCHSGTGLRHLLHSGCLLWHHDKEGAEQKKWCDGDVGVELVRGDHPP